jgi:hypothetical protein
VRYRHQRQSNCAQIPVAVVVFNCPVLPGKRKAAAVQKISGAFELLIPRAKRVWLGRLQGNALFHFSDPGPRAQRPVPSSCPFIDPSNAIALVVSLPPPEFNPETKQRCACKQIATRVSAADPGHYFRLPCSPPHLFPSTTRLQQHPSLL